MQRSRNSPEAAAYIGALVLISDGHVCRSEVDTLHRFEMERELRLSPGVFAQVVQTLCNDRLTGAYTGGSMMCSVDEATLASLPADVDDLVLQTQVRRLASATAKADTDLANAAAIVSAAACPQWRIGDPRRLFRGKPLALQPA